MSNQILIGGDFHPSQSFYNKWMEEGREGVFNNAIDLIDEAKMFITNFECAVGEGYSPINKDGSHLKTADRIVSILKNLGFNGFNLANNHSMDFGAKGLESTIRIMEENGLIHFGSVKNNQETKGVRFLEVEDKIIAIYGIAEKEFNSPTRNSSGVNILDPINDSIILSEAKSIADLVIVLYHGGLEYYPYPTPKQQDTCRFLARNGADIVICQHSHVIGASEWFDNSFILYGQGNFMIPKVQRKSTEWDKGLLVSIELNQQGFDVSLVPIKQLDNGSSIQLLQSTDSKAILERQAYLSNQLYNDAFVKLNFEKVSKERELLYLSRLSAENRVIRFLRKKTGIISRGFFRDYATQRNLIECSTHLEILETIWNLNDGTNYE